MERKGEDDKTRKKLNERTWKEHLATDKGE
jgi:hypothetical protein